MLARLRAAWAWLAAHSWVAFAALGALLVGIIEAVLRRKATGHVDPLDTSLVAHDAGRAEVHEEQARAADAQAAELKAEIAQADETMRREETADHGLSGSDEEIVAAINARLRAGRSK